MAALHTDMLENAEKELSLFSEQRHTLDSIIEQGVYGTLFRANDSQDNDARVAIKRTNAPALQEKARCERILREIKLLAHFRDVNIVGLRDIVVHRKVPFQSLYMVMDLMQTDLYEVLCCPESMLTDEHIRLYIYQLLRALHVLHSAGVTHDNITPKTVLVNNNCDLKLCDVGIARKEDQPIALEDQHPAMHWYQAPERVMGDVNHGHLADVWSAGMVLLDMLGSKPFTLLKDTPLQIDAIVQLIGKPTPEEISRVGTHEAQQYLSERVKKTKAMNFKKQFRNAHPDALDLLQKMLQFDPSKRISAGDALKHPYFNTCAAIVSPVSDVIQPFPQDTTHFTSVTAVQQAILGEVAQIHMNRCHPFPRRMSDVTLLPSESSTSEGSRSSSASLHDDG